MAKAAVSRLKQNSFEERERSTGDQKSEKKSDSSGIRGNARLRKKGKKRRGGGNGGEDLEAKCGWGPA